MRLEWFTPYMEDGARPVPRVIEETTVDSGNVIVQRLEWDSHVDALRRNRIYAVQAFPRAAAASASPGILILHGGTQGVQEELAIAYARWGYAAISPELPGIASPDGSSRSAGLWKSVPYGLRHLDAVPDARASSVFEAIVTALHAFAVFRAQAVVEREAIGVRGLSWGGFLATLVGGLLGSRVQAVCSIYGSGYFDQGSYFTEPLRQKAEAERTAWLEQLDAGRYAGGITARYFMMAASNDTFFWPPAVMATLEAMNCDKNQVFSPNDDHRLDHIPQAFLQELAFFEYRLKGTGRPLPAVRGVSLTRRDEAVEVCFEAEHIIGGIAKAALYYSRADRPWKEREWLEMAAVQGEDHRFIVIANTLEPSLLFDGYVLVTDGRGFSASSLLFRLGGA